MDELEYWLTSRIHLILYDIEIELDKNKRPRFLNINNESDLDELIRLNEHKTTRDWIEEHLLKSFTEFTRRFSNNTLNKKLVLLLSLSTRNNDYLCLIMKTAHNLINVLDNLNLTCHNYDTFHFHSTVSYYLRVSMYKLNRREDTQLLSVNHVEIFLNSTRIHYPNRFVCVSAQVVWDLIKNLNIDLALSYLVVFMPYLLAGLEVNSFNSSNNTSSHDEEFIFYSCIEYIHQILGKFKLKLSPYISDLISLIIKSYNRLKENNNGCLINVILNLFVEMLEQINKEFKPIWIDMVISVIDEVSFDSNVYSNLSEMNKLRNDCLRFYTKLCSINVKHIYVRRFKLIEFLNVINYEYGRIYYEDNDGYLVLLNALEFIRNIINSWNFEIFILLDVKHVNDLFKYGCESINDDVKNLAEYLSNITNMYKANLRKFYIKNGYAKLLI